jgi:hypothetical protein
LSIRVTHGVISNFALDLAVLGNDQVWIGKCLSGLFEADFMLRKIAFGFLRPPSEFNIQ